MQTALHEQNCDFVCLQETQGEHHKRKNKIVNWPEQSQVEFLANNHWPHFIYGKNAIYKNSHHGNGLLSKYPIQQWENIDISTKKYSSRSILHGIIKLPEQNKSLHILCTHLGLFAHERQEQLANLTARLKSHVPHDEPLIIAGDFNDWRKQAEQHICETLQLKEAFYETHQKYAKTFPAMHPTLAVDRIYYRGLTLVQCEKIVAKPWRKLSDHIPLWANFIIK
ncbi:MAG: endonuclease/exonuclease/phosphatase family protein [Gammaproteobacteria bacterium]|nr:endonuclease/exonuclease/phosphatase family protein [Gammaproteobacteria bacterium]